MAKGPLSDRLEYVVLEIITDATGTHQDSWGRWMTTVTKRVPDLERPADLKAAFKRLHSAGIVRLSMPNDTRYHGSDYSGSEADDDAFFFAAGFNVTITDLGRSYWDRIKASPKGHRIGF